jgi:hypothetical protein
VIVLFLQLLFPKRVYRGGNKQIIADRDETTLILNTAAGEIPPENNNQSDPNDPRIQADKERLRSIN